MYKNPEHIYVLPSQTTIGKKYYNKTNITEVNKYIIKQNEALYNYGVLDSSDIKHFFITGLSDDEKQLPIFTYPVLIDKISKYYYLVTDVRKMVKPVKDKPEYLINISRDNPGLFFELDRSIFTRLLLDNGMDNSKLTQLSDYSGLIYSYWVTSAMSASALNFTIEERLKVLSTVFHFYYCRTHEDTLNDSNYQKLIYMATKLLPVDIKFAENIYIKLIKNDSNSNTANPVNVADLSENIKIILNNSKSKIISPLLIFNSIANTWYGPSSTINLPIALEHIPTWLSVLKSTLEETTYRRSILSTIIKNQRKPSLEKNFLLSYKNIIKENVLWD